MMDRTNFEFAAPMICANCPISPGATHCVLAGAALSYYDHTEMPQLTETLLMMQIICKMPLTHSSPAGLS